MSDHHPHDISLDDVRDYLLHSGAIKEAETFLHVVETEERQKEENENQIAKEISHFKPRQIKERIESDRENKRDEILRRLLTEKKSGTDGMLQEEEEMRRLQAMESRLREENAETELMHQRLAIEMQDAKRLQLDDLTAQTRREMLSLEAKRREMEQEMAKQQAEVEKIQNELREAEQQLLASDVSERAEVNRPVVTIDSRRQQLQDLAEQHANKLSMSNAYKLSAQNDKFQLENGGFFDSKLYNVKYDDPARRGHGRLADPASIVGPANGTMNQSSELVDSLTSELGIRALEQRVNELDGLSPLNEKNNLDDLPVSEYEKRRQEGQEGNSRLQFNGDEKMAAKDFLDKWLASDEKVDVVLGKVSTPQRSAGIDHEQSVTESSKHISEVARARDVPMRVLRKKESLERNGGEIIPTPSSARSEMNEEAFNERNVSMIRSQSADKNSKSRDSPSRSFNRSSHGKSDVRNRSENPPDEYVYQQRFDPSRARQQKEAEERVRPSQRALNNSSHGKELSPGVYNPIGDGAYNRAQYPNQQDRQHQQHFPPPHGYHHQQMHPPPPNFFTPQNPYYQPPHVQHNPHNYPHNPYNSPHQHPPYPQNQHHPYEYPGSYPQMHPPHQPLLGHPPNPSHYQAPFPMAHLQPSIPHHQQPLVTEPPRAEDSFFGEMDKLQKMIESENEKLLSNPALSDLKNVPSANGKDSEVSADGNVIPANIEPPRRRNRAELKHHYEMEAIKHDMEKMRQVNALEELKAQLEREKATKKVEVEHQLWLDDQKRLMQSLKIKQAVLAEEDNYKRTESAINSIPPPASSEPQLSEKGTDIVPEKNLKRENTVAPLNYVDKLSVTFDGVTLMPSIMFGDQFRVCISLFECKSKKMVGRAYQSEWESWAKPVPDTRSPGVTKFLNNAISKNPPSKMYSKRNAVKCDMVSPLNLSKDKGNFLKVLAEVQAKELGQPHQSLGWIVFDLPLVSPLQGLPVVDRDSVKVSVGAWRMRARRGIKDAFGSQMSSRVDGLDMWLLFRVNAPDEAQIDSLKGSYLTSEETFRRHEPLDGDFGIHPSESKNNQFGPVKKVVNALSAINSLKSSLVDKSSGSTLPSRPTSSVSRTSVKSATSRRSEAIRSLNSVVEEDNIVATPASRKSFARAQSSRSNASKARTVVSKSKSTVRSRSRSRTMSSRSTSRSRSRSRSISRSRSSRSRSRSSGSRSWSSRSSSRSRSSGSSRSSNSSRQSFDEKDRVDADDPMSKFWTLGTPVRPCDSKYQKGDGVDIYIDSAMFLPDNCTITRVVVKLMTSDFEVIGEVHEAVAVANEGSNISPVYNFKIECRKDVFNMTLTALIRIDTMDSVTLDTVGVGYAAIKVFSTIDRQQPTTPKQPNCFINSGLFQLPLHGGRLKKGEMSEKALKVAGLPRIPCATLLVRIYAAPKAPDGLLVLSRSDYPKADWQRMKVDIPAPAAYLNGDYDGSECESIFPLELTAFEAKCSLPTKTIEIACAEAVSAKPKSSLKGHVKPRPDNASPAEAVTWLRSLLLPVSSTKGILDYGLAVPYSFVAGMSVTVERLFRMPKLGVFSSTDILHKVIYSTSPPGLLYKDPPLAEGTHFTANTKQSSELFSPEFEDGPVIFNPTNIEQNLCLIFDVRLLNLEFDKLGSKYKMKIDKNTDMSKSKDKRYWTFFPIGAETVLKGGFSHMVSGVFQMPLFEGPVPSAVLESLNPMRHVLDTLSSKKSTISLCESGASVIFKCLNPTLGGVLAKEHDNWTDHVSTKYMDMILHAARSGGAALKPDNFSYIHGEYMGAVKTVEKQFSKGNADFKKMLRDINREFADAFDLKFDD
mmetsp:Transcript_9379/g.17508  ORF Transcript_9379/g.17508 Transcript_9379/m.17508 type:complete len:1823 (-) Transcript_9379:160-5628(-)